MTLLSNPMLSVLTQATRYLYVVYWTYKFYCRFLVGHIIPPVLVVLSALELASASAHASSWVDTLSPALKIALSALLFAVAAVLIYHHHRLEKRIKRHAVLLSSIMVLLEAQTLSQKSANAVAAERACSDIIDTLVFALQYERPGNIRASIVFRGDEKEPFQIRVQDNNKTFNEQIALDPLRSTAAKVAQEEFGTIVYVPWTLCIHGVRISAGESRSVGRRDRFRTTQIVDNAFQQIPDHYNKDVLRSLLCIRIPIDVPGTAVLCISGGKRDCMGDLDFHAAKLAAALLSIASRSQQ